MALDATATSYAFDWTSDRSVQMQDATFCLGDMSCQSGGTHVGVPHGGAGAGTVSMTLQGAPASATAFRELSIFARDRDGLGLATNYVSCAAVAADQPCQ